MCTVRWRLCNCSARARVPTPRTGLISWMWPETASSDTPLSIHVWPSSLHAYSQMGQEAAHESSKCDARAALEGALRLRCMLSGSWSPMDRVRSRRWPD